MKAIIKAAQETKEKKRIIHLSTVGVRVEESGGHTRGWFEQTMLSAIHYFLVPMMDSQATIETLQSLKSDTIEWVAVRPCDVYMLC
jgi:hypothetical protein